MPDSVHPAPSSRRRFLGIGAGLFVGLVSAARPAWAESPVYWNPCGVGGGRATGVKHPDPRPGIDASRVLTPEQLADYPDAIAVYDKVRQIPQIVDGIYCHCGCAILPGYRSLLTCYEEKGMARGCQICQGQGNLAFRLHRAGKSLDQIRAAIDARYGDG